MMVNKNIRRKYVKFSELNVGDKFMYKNRDIRSVFYCMKMESSYGSCGILEFNAVNLETGNKVIFTDDDFVIPTH